MIAFEPPVTAIRGKSVEEVLRELTADLDKESQDSKELTRVYTRLHRLLYHRWAWPASMPYSSLLLWACTTLSVPP